MNINLDGIQETMLIPLWSRAEMSRVYGSILFDKLAIELADKINYDFSEIDKHFNKYVHLMNFIRAKMIDEHIKIFLKQYPEASIVNLGSGLDTTFFRIDNGILNWYDIDLPEVIELRKNVIPETERSRCIKASIFENDWFNKIKKEDGVLFISGGVLEYFDKATVKKFLIDLLDNFSYSEIVFNTSRMNFLGYIFMQISFNKAGMKVQAPKLGLIDRSLISRWDKRIIMIENYPLFSKIKKEYSFDGKTLKALNLYDRLKVFNIIHLKLTNSF